MHVLTLFIAVLAPATLINGLLTQDTHEQSNIATRNNPFVSHVRVKRDVPLTARDIEEADQHGVDLNKSKSYRDKPYMNFPSLTELNVLLTLFICATCDFISGYTANKLTDQVIKKSILF